MSSGKKTYEPDWRPQKRTKSAKGKAPDLRDRVLTRDKVCQVCGGKDCKNHPLTMHHIVGKDLGGDDVEANLATVGGTGTTKCHGKVQTLEKKACSRLRKNLRPEQIGYVVAKKSQAWLDRYYPVAA